jgi:hypothetical protein
MLYSGLASTLLVWAGGIRLPNLQVKKIARKFMIMFR